MISVNWTTSWKLNQFLIQFQIAKQFQAKCQREPLRLFSIFNRCRTRRKTQRHDPMQEWLTASLRGFSPWIREDVVTCLPKHASILDGTPASPRSIPLHLREKARERDGCWRMMDGDVHEEDTGGGVGGSSKDGLGLINKSRGLIGYLALLSLSLSLTSFAFFLSLFLLPLCLFWKLFINSWVCLLWHQSDPPAPTCCFESEWLCVRVRDTLRR